MLGFVLGPLLEKNLRQSLILSKGSFLIFFTRPLAAIGLSIALLLFISSFIFILRQKKTKNPRAGVTR